MRRSPIQHTLALVRSKLNLGQKELAALVGCTTDTIKSVEVGRLSLSESLALRVSLETGVDLHWLLKNDLNAPVAFSPEAVAAGAVFGEGGLDENRTSAGDVEPYGPKTFEMIQAKKRAPRYHWPVYMEQLAALVDHARLRAAVENARKNNLFELARYKVDKFLEQMEADFGSDPKVFTPPNQEQPRLGAANLRAGYHFADAEITSAKAQLKLLGDHGILGPDATDEELVDLDTRLVTMQAVSPYEDTSDPKVAKRIEKTFRRLRKEQRSDP